MKDSSAQEPSALSVHAEAGLFSEAELQLAWELVSDGQAHLFADWDEPGTHDEEKRRFNPLFPALRSDPMALSEASRSVATSMDASAEDS